ncbi:MAG: YesL family protein [Oscillospiraceae bacterium]|nr:YesL family protein [Oscillospiraceae bacterium]MBQ2061711.1 YesL family protein [Oscillospiraceae bacterium]
MRRLLDINNPIMRFLTAMFDLMALSVLWVVFSLPIFTMGAASTALYSAAYHHVRKGEDYLWNSFFSAFKENFRRSTLTWLVALAILGFLGADALLLRSLILQGYSFGWFYGVTLALVVLALTWTVYLAAYAARFNGTVKEVLRYSFMLLRAHPVKMLCVMVLVMGGMALALTLPATVVFIPATVYWGATFPIEWTFLKHMRPEDKARMEKEKFE